jgi:hypothetical protein
MLIEQKECGVNRVAMPNEVETDSNSDGSSQAKVDGTQA